MTIELGDRVVDEISGFTGVVTAYAKHLTGCDRVWVYPPIDKEGKLVEGAWFDIIQLKVVDKAVVKTHKPTPAEKPGGPPSRVK